VFSNQLNLSLKFVLYIFFNFVRFTLFSRTNIVLYEKGICTEKIHLPNTCIYSMKIYLSEYKTISTNSFYQRFKMCFSSVLHRHKNQLEGADLQPLFISSSKKKLTNCSLKQLCHESQLIIHHVNLQI
jgi:hypothetical protein